MAAPEKEVAKSELPDPKEVAKTYAEVAQRASKLLADHIQKQVKKGISAPADELGIAQAFMDMMGKLLANPYRLAQAQMNLVWDYFSLWQHSMMRLTGVGAGSPGGHPRQGRQALQGRRMAGALPVRLHEAVLPHRRPSHPRHREQR
jgi:polyhydroxyalkanoate synthase